jgi:hypothetical protein
MDFIDFTVLPNGILFDTSETESETLFVFRPSTFHTIVRVSVTVNKMSYKVSDGTDFNFSYNGVGEAQLKINGNVAESNLDLFNQFIALL